MPVVLAGDYDVVPTDGEIYATRSYTGNALLQPEVRDAYRQRQDQGWTDALRSLIPDDPMFTFWAYERHRWFRDAGLRLDHLLVTPDLALRLASAGVDRSVRGEPTPATTRQPDKGAKIVESPFDFQVEQFYYLDLRR